MPEQSLLKHPKSFYTMLSTSLFPSGLIQKQVDTINAILVEMSGMPIEFVAYTLATAYHETGHTSRMTPNRENLYYTTASRIRAVWPSRFKSTASAKPYLRNSRKLANFVYNNRLGNLKGSDDGFYFRGGGLDHLTGRAHYESESKRQGVDLAGRSDLIMTVKVAVSSLVNGMVTGRYRGRALKDYMSSSGFDYHNARNIVNADVKLYGATVAAHAQRFEKALRAGGFGKASVDVPRSPAVIEVSKAPAPSGWFKSLLALFGIRQS